MTDQHSVKKQFSNDLLIAKGWPANFDFNKDSVCQTVFKPFIEEQLEKLKKFDAQRILRVGQKPSYLFYEHALSASQDIKETCLAMSLGKIVANNMYWATLIHDIGKPELPPEIWDYTESPPPEIKRKKRTHTTLGGDIFRAKFNNLQDHPFFKLALDIIENHHERMDGKGPKKLRAEQLSFPVRLASIIEDYDGRTHLRPHHQKLGIGNTPPEVFARMEEKCIGWFDKDMYQWFKRTKLAAYNAQIDLENRHGLHDGPF